MRPPRLWKLAKDLPDTSVARYVSGNKMIAYSSKMYTRNSRSTKSSEKKRQFDEFVRPDDRHWVARLKDDANVVQSQLREELINANAREKKRDSYRSSSEGIGLPAQVTGRVPVEG